MEVKINETEMAYNHTIIHCIDKEYYVREYDGKDYTIENLRDLVSAAHNKCPWIYQPNLKTFISMSYNNFKNYENFIINLPNRMQLSDEDFDKIKFMPKFMGFDIVIDLDLPDNEYLFNIKSYYNVNLVELV